MGKSPEQKKIGVFSTGNIQTRDYLSKFIGKRLLKGGLDLGGFASISCRH